MLYLSPTNDLVFKKLFGTEANKDLLISFLNGILGRKGDKLITYVDFRDPYNHQPSMLLKLSIVDVRCRDKAGNTYIVEMQVNEQTDFLARCHYYAACGLSLQLKKGDEYEELLPVIFIGITDFEIFSGHNRYLSHYQLLDTVDHVCRLHHEEYYFVELPKFTKTVEQLEDIADKWIYFLQNAEKYENPPQELQKTQSFVKAFDVLERGRWTRKELEDYEKMIDAERVEKSVLKTAEAKAEARGEKKERSKIAKEMLKKNTEIDYICEITGLSEQEIEELKSSMKN
jgi:conserved hypothetical protein (putative transposase or invertase)